ncbi:MAG: SusC/RagA family TonB-linked outer membrane protein, partial [Bacteroidota bacterium]
MKKLRNLWKGLLTLFPKLSLKMKFSLLFFTAILFQLHAENGYAQRTRLSLNLNNVSVMDAINEIESQSDFKFFYSKEDLNADRKVSLNVRRKRIEDVLPRLFPIGTMSYEVIEKQVVLSPSTLQPDPPTAVITKQQDPITVTGQVTNTDGIPLPGVSVIVKGTTRGVATDFDGNYRIVVPNTQSVLVISSIGYTEQEITVGTQTTINVKMEESVSQLGEVVVSTGYWETTQKLNPGNIAKVDFKLIEQQPVTNPLQSLQGRVAGVNINQRTGVPGGGIDIEIRGRNSIRPDGNLPFYVIDGVPFTGNSITSPFLGGEQSGGNPLSLINPNDIESIEILKDADATAIYGSRGANGVVLITTKKGSAGETKISLDVSSGFGEVPRMIDLLNTPQYLEMRNEAFRNDGREPGFRDYDVNGTWDQNRFTDWQEVLIGGQSDFTRAQISLSGGNSNTNFLLSGGYQRESTVFPGSNSFQRISGALSVNNQSKNGKLLTSVSLNYSAQVSDLIGDGFTRQVSRLQPNAPELYNEDGTLNWENSTWNNPLAILEQDLVSRINNFIANGTISYYITPELDVRLNLGYTNMQSNETETNPLSAIDPARRPGRVAVTTFGDGSLDTWIVEPQINYTKSLGEGKLSVTLGATQQESIQSGETVAATFTSDALSLNINAADEVFPFEANYTQYRYTALFSRLNYNWKERYVINGTLRRDGSSRFGPNNRFGNFGAVGAAWIFSEEKFVKSSLGFIDFGKLRGSYGVTGNDQIGDYQFLETYSASDFRYAGEVGLVLSRLPNSDFSWEIVKKLEFGMELSAFNNRIGFTSSWFRNRSDNQLIGIPLPDITGFNSISANWPAVVENRGWEFTLDAKILRLKNFEWSTNINLTIPQNELVEFDNLEGSSFENDLKIGESLFIQPSLEATGVNPESGVYSFVDANFDGDIRSPEDNLVFPEIATSYFGGIANTISFGGFKLDFLFEFRKQTGRSFISLFSRPGGSINQPVEVLDRWQNPGDIS